MNSGPEPEVVRPPVSPAAGTSESRPPFQLKRLGVIMEPEPGNPWEAEGVLNPAAARGADGCLYLFPRLVGSNNFSRIGIARVRFDGAGHPAAVERLGVAVEPTMDYERRPDGGGGCEDPRITFVEDLQAHVMTYTAFGPTGPRIALALSEDLFHWRKLGRAEFEPLGHLDFGGVDNKDALIFSEAVSDPHGRPAMAIIHRPLFPGTHPHQIVHEPAPRSVDIHRESMWISYCPSAAQGCSADQLCKFNSHHRLASPAAPWERLKIGGGTPPLRTAHGWLVLYHGVCGVAASSPTVRSLRYSAGAMILSPTNPCLIRYRSREPILTPELSQERTGFMANVVFPTAIDRRTDIGRPDRLDVYYGMADQRIGVATMELPECLPEEARADAPAATV